MPASASRKAEIVSDDALIRGAVISTSLGRIDEAVDAWAALVHAGIAPTIASIMLVDCARRCGRFHDAAAQEAAAESVFLDTEYLSRHRSALSTIVERRSRQAWPDTLEGLSAEALRSLGRTAQDCHFWRYAISVWQEFLGRGGNLKEGFRRLAQCHAALGDHAETIVYCNEALRLGPDAQLERKLDRARRLEARARDGFYKHAGRLVDHPAMKALQAALKPLLARNALLVADLSADAAVLGATMGMPLIALRDGEPTESVAVVAPVPPASAAVPDFDVRARETADIPLFVSDAYRCVLSDITYPACDDEIVTCLATRRFDSVMFVANGFLIDPRVLKTAQTVSGIGRRLLAVGLRGNTDPHAYELKSLADGTPLLLLPNLNRPINIAMRARKFPTAERGVRMELWLASMAMMLAPLLKAIASDGVLHTHDYHGIYVGGIALDRAGLRGRHRWVHDVHELISQYDIIDPGLQAAGTAWEKHYIHGVDYLSTVSEELGERLSAAHALATPPTIIYSANRLAALEKYHGPKSREKLGLGRDAILLVHSGNIVPGRGVDLVVRALASRPDVHLLLITESKNAYVDELRALAAQLGVEPRIHWHGYLPYDEAMGFMSDADIGIIPMDRYGNTNVALPNKLFDYVLAGLPIVSSNADAMVRFLRDWKIGVVFEEKSAEDFARKLAIVLDDLPRYRSAIRQRMDRVFACSWEMQQMKIARMYAVGEHA